VAHSEIRIGGSTIVIVDQLAGSGHPGPRDGRSPRIELAFYTDDVDAWFARAVAAGATIAMPVTDVFWGDRYGKVMDPFGQIWALATRREHLTPEQVLARSSGRPCVTAESPEPVTTP
jgi:uncharacterized glyoxalase superfamily protein PhnB